MRSSDTRAVPEAIARAKAYLHAEADRAFAETRHVMRFPHGAGFHGEVEAHASGPFARAVLAGALLDVADHDGDDAAFCRWARAVARREAAHVAACRLTDRAGGWSYFPTLPELPPDLDSLAAALTLFARAALEFLPLCEEPIALALAQVGDDGAMETWLIAGRDAIEDRQAMDRGVARHWGRGADVDVCARFYHALWLADAGRFGHVVRQGARFVQSRQRPDGGWDATWYWGQAQACDLAMRLLHDVGAGDDARARGARFLLASQWPDGGWGTWESVPLDTGLALAALMDAGACAAPPEALARGIEALLHSQTLPGFWKGTPWIKMDIGRASGRVTRTATYRSSTITTAFCLRALIAYSASDEPLERRQA